MSCAQFLGHPHISPWTWMRAQGRQAQNALDAWEVGSSPGSRAFNHQLGCCKKCVYTVPQNPPKQYMIDGEASLGLNLEFKPDQDLPCFSSSLHSFPLETAIENMKLHIEASTADPRCRIPSTPRCISICRSSCSRFRRSSFLRSPVKKK